eukprot:TRINITY_DN1725_c0_g1_i1.p1 TRINITY_DN1725_c0_g1~~TRINITY_DN1725_c0_g1_i1.p1  ORF type:complete len:292 (-),score=61.30 TRINITY_DN1725_c0_g1_i1:44-919(-)
MSGDRNKVNLPPGANGRHYIEDDDSVEECDSTTLARTSREGDEEQAIMFQHQNDVFKRLVVCGHYHRKVAEELHVSQIIETREKRWTSTLNERDYLDLVEQAVVSFDKACVHSGILVQLPHVKEEIRARMKALESGLSTAFLEVVNALKGGFVFHFWEENMSVPQNTATESRDECELTNTMRTAYLANIKFDLEHNKTVQWYLTKNEAFKCSMTVDFKICYINVGIIQNMIRTNTLQIKKSATNTLEILCRSFNQEGRPICHKYAFDEDDTMRIEQEVNSFQEANLLTHTR